ncbi:MAG: flavodoxin [Streptococcaceae bacterium]|jgi:flavodoxin short chain|nr:flavodoxin [Streptococcaceae bacterium]
MTKVLVDYASMTGNTEECAQVVADKLENLGLDVEMVEATTIDSEDLLDYDLIVLAAYTYGAGDLPDEMVDLYEELDDLDLTGKVYGVVGSGDTFYEDDYCKSVDEFDEKLASRGATRGAESVKVDLSPEDDDIARLEAFASELAAKVS